MRELVIGVDGGGTSTRFAVADVASSSIIKTISTGSISPYVYSWEHVITNIKMGLASLFNDATGLNPNMVRVIALGVSGVDRPEHEVNFARRILPLLPNSIVKVVNDSVIALLGGMRNREGLLAISGTGSITFGMKENGDTMRVGGWGHVLGDEGSGYRLGLQAMRRVMRSHDKVNSATMLTDLVLGYLDLKESPDLLDWTNEINGDKAHIAALAVCVHEAAETRDQAALQILEIEARGLARQVETVHRRLFTSDLDHPVEVICAGGNLVNGREYFRIFGEIVSGFIAQAEIKHPDNTPVVGAVRLAMNSL
jgi:N-acetylglucosamine kinase-like BadF-type ATPase